VCGLLSIRIGAMDRKAYWYLNLNLGYAHDSADTVSAGKKDMGQRLKCCNS